MTGVYIQDVVDDVDWPAKLPAKIGHLIGHAIKMNKRVEVVKVEHDDAHSRCLITLLCELEKEPADA